MFKYLSMPMFQSQFFIGNHIEYHAVNIIGKERVLYFYLLQDHINI
jgi:hypothetical protein